MASQVLISKIQSMLLANQKRDFNVYRIYSNKRRGAYLIFRATSAALIRGRRLFKHCTRHIYFFLYFYSTAHFLSVIFPMD